MTLTETRTEETAALQTVSAAALTIPESFLTTGDHKRLGRYYVFASVVFVLVSAVIGVLLEIELSGKGNQIVGHDWDRLFALHGTAGAMLFLTGLWIGLATYLVPLQIGARRLAFPRVASLAFWGYVGGGLLLLASYTFGTPNGVGILSSAPLVPGKPGAGAGHATDLWAAALVMLTLASMMAAANLFVTVLKLRVPGLTMGRTPAFSWSVLAISAAVLLTGPLFIVGMALVYLDQHFGGGVFAPNQRGADLIWQHLVWLYGRPDVYLIAVPCLGAGCDIVATHARRPLFQSTVAKGLIFAAAVLSFAILTADSSIRTAVLIPTPSILSVAVGIPVGLCALLWLGTIRPQALQFNVSLLYVVGFLLFLVAAVVMAAIAPSQHLHGSEFTVGQIHAVLFAAPALMLFGALYHWSPKIWGRGLNQLIGVLQWLLLVAGFGATSAGAWLAGFDGAPWHVDNYTQARASDFFNYAKLSTAGGVLVALGFLVFLANAGMAWMRAHRNPGEADPYEAATLEWATSSPPPPENFETVPDIRSDAPLADLRAREAAAKGTN